MAVMAVNTFSKESNTQVSMDRGVSRSVRDQYFEAAKSWQTLIQDAVTSNPQFAVLWREHKQDSQRSPFMQALRDGSFLQAAGILVVECARWQQNCGNTQGLSKGNHPLVCEKPGHPIPRSLRMDIYRFFSAEKKRIKKVLKDAGTKVDDNHAGTKVDDNGDSEEIRQQKKQSKRIIQDKQLKHLILLEGL